MILKNRVAEVREAAGLSVYELCARAGLFSTSGQIVSRSVVLIEDGKNPNIQLALKVFMVLKETGKVETFEELFWLEGFDVQQNLEALKAARKNS